ncbi:hypothetical protein ITP53_37785 [Nonomuraea sp. K274]|uniref:Uncharacterized protein n=1 Tax=Nonomuraea cypriaca TaxID=1187855 RepID=A0A931AEE9_9ACTN|nr:hypothetical protein [Nonomuraea cypriaca]MBF8191356.1 hypothetical protein [Nonomuraea cypriaca]
MTEPPAFACRSGEGGRPRVVARGRRDPGDGVPPEVAAFVALIVARQLRQALVTVGAVAGLLVGLPVIAQWVPEPGVWVALPLGAQGAWVALAVLQLRRAERLER